MYRDLNSWTLYSCSAPRVSSSSVSHSRSATVKWGHKEDNFKSKLNTHRDEWKGEQKTNVQGLQRINPGDSPLRMSFFFIGKYKVWNWPPGMWLLAEFSLCSYCWKPPRLLCIPSPAVSQSVSKFKVINWIKHIFLNSWKKKENKRWISSV